MLPDDSLSMAAGDPILEYQLASARISYIRLRGWLPGRVKKMLSDQVMKRSVEDLKRRVENDS